jgi:hypothetical protein
MGAKRVQYSVVGRYMSGREVTGYHLQSIESGKTGRYTKEQLCFLIGRDQVSNCTAQIYKDTIVLSGKGIRLDSLPVKQETGELKNTESVGKVRKDTSAADVMSQFMIVGIIKYGRNTIGYTIKNAGGATKKIKRDQVMQLAQAGKLGNARVQRYQDKLLLRGVNCNLDELPCEQVKPQEEQPAKTVEKPVNSTTSADAFTLLTQSIQYVLLSELKQKYGVIENSIEIEKYASKTTPTHAAANAEFKINRDNVESVCKVLLIVDTKDKYSYIRYKGYKEDTVSIYLPSLGKNSNELKNSIPANQELTTGLISRTFTEYISALLDSPLFYNNGYTKTVQSLRYVLLNELQAKFGIVKESVKITNRTDNPDAKHLFVEFGTDKNKAVIHKLMTTVDLVGTGTNGAFASITTNSAAEDKAQVYLPSLNNFADELEKSLPSGQETTTGELTQIFREFIQALLAATETKGEYDTTQAYAVFGKKVYDAFNSNKDRLGISKINFKNGESEWYMTLTTNDDWVEIGSITGEADTFNITVSDDSASVVGADGTFTVNSTGIKSAMSIVAKYFKNIKDSEEIKLNRNESIINNGFAAIQRELNRKFSGAVHDIALDVCNSNANCASMSWVVDGVMNNNYIHITVFNPGSKLLSFEYGFGVVNSSTGYIEEDTNGYTFSDRAFYQMSTSEANDLIKKFINAAGSSLRKSKEWHGIKKEA